MKLYQKIIAGILFILSFVLTCLFKNLPTGKLWDDYSVLYVKADVSDYAVSELLHQKNITNYLSMNNQFLPLNINPYAPEISYLQSNYDSPEFSYLARRNAYFFDKSNSYRIYYIPTEYKSKIGEVVTELNSRNVFCGLDTTANYPFILPILTFILSLIFLFFSKNKIVFGISAILPVLFIFFNPFYAIGIAILLVLLCLFLISNLWKRKNWLLILVSDYAIPTMLLFSIVSAFACNYKTGLLYLLCILGTAGIVVLYYDFENYLMSKKSFIPVYIISAKRKNMFAQKTKFILPVTVGFCSIVLVFFLLTSFGNLNSKSAKILVPAQKGTISENLPDLEEYYQWVWNVKTAPYKSLNKNSSDEQVSYPRYITNEDGTVSETFDNFIFSDDFKENAYSEIDNIKFESIEKLLKKQGKNFKAGYSSTSSYKVTFFAIIVVVINYFILLFFFISIIIRKGFKK